MGSNSGFKNKFYLKEKGAYGLDVLECPFKKYLTELCCPELTRIFCENDECVYGNIPGLVFERKGALGKGADRCGLYNDKRTTYKRLRQFKSNRGSQAEKPVNTMFTGFCHACDWVVL